MEFKADLHIHSRFSRATSKDLDLEHLYIAAQCKGITVVGTGDITHPQWFAEVSQKLVPAEQGLYALRSDRAGICDKSVPAACHAAVRFLLTAEVSNIYKKDERTRKNHNLIFFPSLDAVQRFTTKLARIGNISADGRPILGLDSRNLLEMVLENGAGTCLIPAHIWTPWFSLLGSKSGFNSVEECFGDLVDHVFALETGLSSDPAMNWRCSMLDRYTLISNSDAHSAVKLGREANRFDTDLSYGAIVAALRTGDPSRFLGTIEFFPEEGKYHLDGHRNCRIRMRPHQTMACDGRCPVCGRPLTLGVLYRVQQLADRPEDSGAPRRHPFHRLVPLEDLLSEILQKGPGSKAVGRALDKAIGILGSEMGILLDLTPAQIARAGIPLLAEAVGRMREGRVHIDPGYDGQFGCVRVFSDQERRQRQGRTALFAIDVNGCQPLAQSPSPMVVRDGNSPETVNAAASDAAALNGEQREAIEPSALPLMVIAGPGTGKTRTLTYKMAAVMTTEGVAPQQILAMTFTQKAAVEMRRRLEELLPQAVKRTLPMVTTFHGFCLHLLGQARPDAVAAVLADEDRLQLIRDAIPVALRGRRHLKAQTAARFIEAAKQSLLTPEDNLEGIGMVQHHQALKAVYRVYQEMLAVQALMDYEDLIVQAVRLLETQADLRQWCHKRFTHIFIDEYQDINFSQQRLLQQLSPQGDNLWVIGDPDQAIYGFRGSSPAFFINFDRLYPSARKVYLTRNYRSTETIVKASTQIIAKDRLTDGAVNLFSGIQGPDPIYLLEASSGRSEVVMVGKAIEKMVGGTGFLAIDAGKVDGHAGKEKSFADIAVIYRTHEQSERFSDMFSKAGIPFQTANRHRLLTEPFIACLVSYLRLFNGSACFNDIERVAQGAVPASVFSVLKAWSLQNRWDTTRALAQLRRFPLPGLTLSQQKRLCWVFDEMDGLKQRLATRTVTEMITALNAFLMERRNVAAHNAQQVDLLLELAAAWNGGLSSFLSALSLIKDTDLCPAKGERVSLMTMHAVKGLEFKVVFIVGLEDGWVPLTGAADLKEERRLLYVAMTRAREQLYLCHARRRRLFGQIQTRQLSPFVADIDTGLLRVYRDGYPNVKKPKPRQLSLF